MGCYLVMTSLFFRYSSRSLGNRVSGCGGRAGEGSRGDGAWRAAGGCVRVARTKDESVGRSRDIMLRLFARTRTFSAGPSVRRLESRLFPVLSAGRQARTLRPAIGRNSARPAAARRRRRPPARPSAWPRFPDRGTRDLGRSEGLRFTRERGAAGAKGQCGATSRQPAFAGQNEARELVLVDRAPSRSLARRWTCSGDL
jgi:hypothetical protein